MSAFIISVDYSVLITDDQLGQITTNQTDIDEAISQAEEEVKEYIRHRYDTDFDMRSVVSHPSTSPVATFSENDRFFSSDTFIFYVAKQDGSNRQFSETAFFEVRDDRNKMLVQKTVDCFLYHLHTRLNPRNIPEHRMKRYDGDGNIDGGMNAIRWLKDIQQGIIHPDLTILLDEDGETPMDGESVIWGDSKTASSADRYGNLTGN